jgi:hypothetical protein
MLLFLAYLNSLAFASGNVANECKGQLSTPRVFGRLRFLGGIDGSHVANFC